MRYLTEKHLIRASAILGLPLEKLVELDSLGLLSHSGVLSLVIRKDWKNLTNRKDCYTNEQIVMALVNEYNVSVEFVFESIKSKRKMPYYCKDCGKEVGYTEYSRNKGLCDHCVVKTIKIDEPPKN